MLKKEKGEKMKKKKIKEEMMIDYVTKDSIVKADKNFSLKYALALCALAGYTAHTFYFASIATADEVPPEMCVLFFFLLVFALSGIFMLIAHPLFSAKVLSEEIEEARKFLLETGQQATRENINILMDRYYKGGWQKIEDMLYEDRKVFLAENMELISGNISNGNLKEALPAK